MIWSLRPELAQSFSSTNQADKNFVAKNLSLLKNSHFDKKLILLFLSLVAAATVLFGWLMLNAADAWQDAFNVNSQANTYENEQKEEETPKKSTDSSSKVHVKSKNTSSGTTSTSESSTNVTINGQSYEADANGDVDVHYRSDNGNTEVKVNVQNRQTSQGDSM